MIHINVVKLLCRSFFSFHLIAGLEARVKRPAPKHPNLTLQKLINIHPLLHSRRRRRHLRIRRHHSRRHTLRHHILHLYRMAARRLDKARDMVHE